ncbi:MAG TPA: hypothetical protein VEA99_04045 [Gemmatimonadaceae bacterium]|nr:hypothetical protein [Gemmatimonadaceae bacterium]
MIMRPYFFLLVASVGVPSVLDAQWGEALPCADAVALLDTGNVAAYDRQMAALLRVPACLPASGPAYAVALSRRRTADASPELTEFFKPQIRHPAVLDTVLSLAADPAASVSVRALSLGIARMYLGDSEWLFLRALTEYPIGEQCAGGLRASPPLLASGTMPSDIHERVRRVASALERSAAVPAGVRSAAHCVMNEWRRLAGLPEQPLIEPSGYVVGLSHRCGQEFILRGYTAHILALQYDVDGGPTRLTIYLASRREGESYSEKRFKAAAVRPVRVFLDGEVVASASPVNGPCS